MAQQNRSKKPAFPWVFVLVAIGLISQLAGGNGDSRAVIGLVGVVVGIAIIFTVIRAALEAKKRSEAAKAPPRSPARSYTPAKSPAALHRAFPEPDAHCVVCENTGEDHFQRDKAQRIRQLDEWLKNGIIDKKEYFVLKDRFEKNL